MVRKCKITVIRKEFYEDLQEQYLADPKSGPCPYFAIGQEFILERSDRRDDFMHMLDGKFCSEAWVCDKQICVFRTAGRGDYGRLDQ